MLYQFLSCSQQFSCCCQYPHAYPRKLQFWRLFFYFQKHYTISNPYWHSLALSIALVPLKGRDSAKWLFNPIWNKIQSSLSGMELCHMNSKLRSHYSSCSGIQMRSLWVYANQNSGDFSASKMRTRRLARRHRILWDLRMGTITPEQSSVPLYKSR